MSVTDQNGQVNMTTTGDSNQELVSPGPEQIQCLWEAASYFAKAVEAAEDAARRAGEAGLRLQMLEIDAHSAHNDVFEKHLNGYDGEYRPMGFTAEHPASGSPQSGPVELAAEQAKLAYERASVEAKQAEFLAERSAEMAQMTQDGLLGTARALFAQEPKPEEPPVRLATSTQPTRPPTGPPQHWDLAETQEAS